MSIRRNRIPRSGRMKKKRKEESEGAEVWNKEIHLPLLVRKENGKRK